MVANTCKTGIIVVYYHVGSFPGPHQLSVVPYCKRQKAWQGMEKEAMGHGLHPFRLPDESQPPPSTSRVPPIGSTSILSSFPSPTSDQLSTLGITEVSYTPHNSSLIHVDLTQITYKQCSEFQPNDQAMLKQSLGCIMYFFGIGCTQPFP